METKRHAWHRSLWWRRGFALLMLAACGAGAFWFGTTRVTPTLLNEGLEVDVSQLSFGEVWETKEFPWSLTISNPTDKRIVITEFASTCGCMSVHPPAVTLAPGDSQRLNLRLDLRLSNEASLNEDFATRILPQIQGTSARQAGWTIRGKLKKAFSMTPAMLRFGDVLLHEKRMREKTIRVTSHLAVKDLLVECDPPLVSYNTKCLDAKRNEYELRLALKDNLPPGAFSFRLSLQALTEKGKAQAFGYATADGFAIREVEIIPPEIHFGAKPVGELGTATIVLQSRTGEPFEVTRINSGPAGPVIALVTNGDTRKTYRLTQKFLNRESRKNDVEFIIRLHNDKQTVLPVTVCYYGTESKVIRVPKK